MGDKARVKTMPLTPLGPPAKTAHTQNLKRLLETLPVRLFGDLVHVGTPGLLHRESHEGPLLSASEYPDAWRRIARLEGPEWKVERSDHRYLRLAVVTSRSANRRVEDWGIEEGLLELQAKWWTPCTTDEEDVLNYAWCDDRDEAYDLWRVNFSEGEAPRPRKKVVAVSTPVLDAFWCQRQSKVSKLSPFHACSAAAAAALVYGQVFSRGGAGMPTLDGLYWPDELNPAIYSAPRAGIVPDDRISVTRI